MQEFPLVNLRDFVYLDVERLKSLLAQLDRGLLTDRSDSVGSSTSVEGKAGVSIPALLEVGGAGQYISTDQATETRTLHDFVYNEVEEKLLELRRIKVLPNDFTSARLLSEEVRATLSPVEYVLVRGRVSFGDYRYLTSLLENFNEILKIITGFTYQGRLQVATEKERAAITREMNREIAGSRLDDGLVKGIRKIFDLFMQDRLLVRVMPFPEDLNVRIVGPGCVPIVL